MRVLDLFSGVGMFAYGMEKAGHEVVAFCEIEEWPRRVLDKHWPDVPKYTDVKELNRERLEEDGVISNTNGSRLVSNRTSEETAATDSGWRNNDEGGKFNDERQGCRTEISGATEQDRRTVDIITGGFPCQDLSVAGKQAGIKGERSGLFDEIIRLACELRPRYIVLENVAALLTGDSGGWARYVFGRLTEIGFDAEWHVIPAGGSNVSAGAPHRRERVWIVAYPSSEGSRHQDGETGDQRRGAGQARGEGIRQGHKPTGTVRTDTTGAKRRDVAYPNQQHFTGDRGGYVGEGDYAPDGARPNVACDNSMRERDVANTQSGEDNGRERGDLEEASGEGGRIHASADSGREDVANTRDHAGRHSIGGGAGRDGEREDDQAIRTPETVTPTGSGTPPETVAHTSGNGSQRLREDRRTQGPSGLRSGEGGDQVEDLRQTGDIRPTEPDLGLLADGIASGLAGSGWLPEPRVGRVATGVPDRVQKLKALGNGLVWQIPAAIGAAIMERENNAN